MNDVIHTNVEVERFGKSGELIYDTYPGVGGYMLMNGVLTVLALDGDSVWSYGPNEYETVSCWEVMGDD